MTNLGVAPACSVTRLIELAGGAFSVRMVHLGTDGDILAIADLMERQHDFCADTARIVRSCTKIGSHWQRIRSSVARSNHSPELW
jgi:hypothetical protein